jgi:hypothetical protein
MPITLMDPKLRYIERFKAIKIDENIADIKRIS